jgi:activating signal cointegrator 1
MKCLSLTEPWATLVSTGHKKVETRGWRTTYRGPILIHASKGFPRWAREATVGFMMKFDTSIPSADSLPLGCILCETSIVDCVQTDALTYDMSLDKLSPMERTFGDYSSGRYAIFLGPVTRIFDPPIPAKGSLGLWEWNENVDRHAAWEIS